MTSVAMKMIKLLLLTIVASSVFIGIEGDKNTHCYRAASFEHIPAGYSDDIDPEDALVYARKNIDAIAIATEAAKGERADIIVFAEDSIVIANKIKGTNSTLREGIALLAEDVPDPRSSDTPIVPCANGDFDDRPILQNLSCIAAEYEIYLVATLADVKNCSLNATECREDGKFFYNTQVAFDRQGSLIGRYHKSHLFGEYFFDTPLQQEFVYFDTDFGARVGMYICFDRMFHDPMITLIQEFNVTTMALSMWWFDEYPLLLSHQIDQFQSTKLNVNIISANAKHLSTGSTGSGIYSPLYTGVTEHDIGKNKRASRPRLMIANLPKNPSSASKCHPDPWSIGISKFSEKPGQVYRPYWSNFSLFQSTQLTEDHSDNVTLCDGAFCCSLKYEFSEEKKNNKKKAIDDTPYYLIVANRTRGGYYLSQYSWTEQICSVVQYDNSTEKYSMTNGKKFKTLEVTGDNFETEYVYATAVSDGFKLIANRDIKQDAGKLSIKSRKPILMAALYGRVYDRDPPYMQTNYGESDEI